MCLVKVFIHPAFDAIFFPTQIRDGIAGPGTDVWIVHHCSARSNWKTVYQISLNGTIIWIQT
jgi:hypothetical protein